MGKCALNFEKLIYRSVPLWLVMTLVLLGMLVLIARQAQRRGVKVTLVEATPRVRGELDTAGVSHFFNWQP